MYLHNNTDTKVIHGICEDCAKKHYPGYLEAMKAGDAADKRGEPDDAQ